MGYFKSYLFLIALVLLFALYESIIVIMYVKSRFMKIVAGIVFVAIIYLGSHRNTYLPFLGPTVLPGKLLKESEKKEGATQVTLFVEMPDDTPVVYWAAQASEGVVFSDPYSAYEDYTNAGVAKVKNNQAILQISCPSSYKVPSGKTLKPHVHYRVVYPNGIMGSVQTMWVACP